MVEAKSDLISVKIVVVGDGNVGKTSMLMSYTTDNFPKDYVPTVFDNYSAKVRVDTKTIMLGLWDTAGQEEYHLLRPLSYSQCDLFLIVYSVVQPQSFENALKKWYPELQTHAPKVAKIFVGNKIDLRESSEYQNIQNTKDKPISTEVATQLISQQNCKYLECSALTKEGLKEVFDEAIKTVLKQKLERPVPRKPKSMCTLI